MKYYHGSMIPLEVGVILTGRGDAYIKDWKDTDFYYILDKYRPTGCLPHSKAVFAVGDPDDIDLAGGGTEWAFELLPIGEVSKHDMNWSSEISCLLSNGFSLDSLEVIQAAKSYWLGVPHPNESVWEYIMPRARIVKVELYEDCFA